MKNSSSHAYCAAGWRDCCPFTVNYKYVLILPVNKCRCLQSIEIPSISKVNGYDYHITLQKQIIGGSLESP